MIGLSGKFGWMIIIFLLFCFKSHVCIHEISLILSSIADFLFKNFEIMRRKLPMQQYRLLI